MGTWWARRAARRRTQVGDDSAADDVISGGGPRRGATGPSPGRVEGDGPEFIDRTDRTGWTARIEPDPVRAAELAARFRARAARSEAQRDLRRLRARHWSGERLVEEARAEREWWEHPEADPYAVLGLLPGARLEEVSSARRRIAQQCHPDRIAPETDPDMALRRMVAANAAYDRLRRALHSV